MVGKAGPRPPSCAHSGTSGEKLKTSFARPRLKILVAFALVPLAFTTLTACSTHSFGELQNESSSSSVEEIDVPPFSGPWADDFAGFYRQASSDFERSILEDGEITDSEFAEMEAKFASCMEKKDIEFQGYKRDGSYEYQTASGADPAAANEAVEGCSKSSGARTVGTLHFAIIRNPQNLDEGEIISTCLVQKKIVPSDYSADDYYRDAPTEAFPYIDAENGNLAFNECAADPLGLFGNS